MIRVMLKGRIGNNLFQYAVGLALAQKHGSPLVLDASRLKEKFWQNSSSLSRLPLQANLLRKLPLPEKITRKLTRRLTLRRMTIVREGDNESFTPAILDSPDDTLLIGYFQSPLYFSSVAAILRQHITPANLEWPSSSTSLAELLSTTESVAVHVRRADYLGNDEFNVCTLGYYQASIARMRKMLPKPHFYIFSDDLSWCRTQFTNDDLTIVDFFPELTSDPLHDLYLMSSARHHIIANSSYSWWGAWLGKNNGQRVICPSRWTNGPERFSIAEKLCENWETVSL